MRKWHSVVLVGFCVALMPGLALAGNGSTGACFVIEGEPVAPDGGLPVAAGCADGFTLEDCSSASFLTEFVEGGTCAELAGEVGFSWDGSCEASIDQFDDVCVQLWSVAGGQASQLLCADEIGGTWFDDLACGGAPVPTMPPLGLAAMMLLLLAGALFMLTMKGSRTAV